MNYEHLADQLRKFPERYLWFGPYWWVIKRALSRAGLEFGYDDDPGVRAQLEQLCGGRAAAEREAMQEYQRNKGAFSNHDFTLPDGEPYFLHDEEMTAYSQPQS